MRYHIFQNIIFLLKGIRQEHPQLLVLLAVEAVLSVISPVFGVYLPKIALELSMSGADTGRILCTLGTIGLLLAVSMALAGMAHEGRYMMYNDMRRYYQTKLFLQSLECDYKYVESEEGKLRYGQAMSTLQNGDWSATSVMIVSATDMVVSTLCFFIYSSILSACSPYMILPLLALSLVSLAGTRHAQGYEYRHRDQAAEYDKKLRYVTDTASSTAFGKDMRLYHAGEWFVELRGSLIGQSMKLTQKIQNRYFAAGMVNALVLLVRDGAAYAWLIYAVQSGQISIAEFTLYFGAVTAFSGFVNRMVDDINQLNSANMQMNPLRDFLNHTKEPQPGTLVKMADLKDTSIEFQDVCFSYQTGEKVLDHLNLKIRAGEKAALVGVNGAGKTTLVKLLCGFYQPDSGRILIGGQDTACFQKPDLRKLFSVVFQDIYIPPFTVAENVSMREAEKTDLSRVRDCLEQAGLWEKISMCERGMHTPVTREITEGLVLSGGQQQKLLLARALYKNAPVLILDEPTAALDPVAESQTYEQFHKTAAGKTTLFISHRLASTRFCDKIAFLSGGRITEEGSHEELMKLGGDYWQMYELQSQYYKDREGQAYA